MSKIREKIISNRVKKIFILFILVILLTGCQKKNIEASNNNVNASSTDTNASNFITNQYQFYKGAIDKAEEAKEKLENTSTNALE